MRIIKVTDRNRDKIAREYINYLIDSMDWDALYTFAEEKLTESKDLLTNEALESEILDYCPHILEE